jgi:hypothetical protein
LRLIIKEVSQVFHKWLFYCKLALNKFDLPESFFLSLGSLLLMLLTLLQKTLLLGGRHPLI